MCTGHRTLLPPLAALPIKLVLALSRLSSYSAHCGCGRSSHAPPEGGSTVVNDRQRAGSSVSGPQSAAVRGNCPSTRGF